jgi:prophage antirepressor-like protein
MTDKKKPPAEKRDGKAVATRTLVVAGQEVSVRVLDGEDWLTADLVAVRLGFSTPSGVMQLYRRHAEELRPYASEHVLCAAGGGPTVVTVFAPKASTIFACLARTAKAREFRAAVVAHVEAVKALRTKRASGRDLLVEAVKAFESERDAIPLKKAKSDHETQEQTRRAALDDVAALGSEGLRILELVDEDINETAKRFRIPLRREDA